MDSSNTGSASTVLTLPRQPDREADRLRGQLADNHESRHGHGLRLGVILSDTAGRPWRTGQTDFALGAAGLQVVDDLRGTPDDDGRTLRVTVRAVADELAAAADLVKAKTTRTAAVLVRGLGRLVTDSHQGADAQSGEAGQLGARSLVRTGPTDWFSLGHVEAIRASLGVAPGTATAVEVGVPSVEAEEPLTRIRRACALATRPEGVGVVPEEHPRRHVFQAQPDLSSVEAELVQNGVRLRARDPFVLGIVVGRLLPALFAEGMAAAVSQSGPPSGATRRDTHSALVTFL